MSQQDAPVPGRPERAAAHGQALGSGATGGADIVDGDADPARQSGSGRSLAWFIAVGCTAALVHWLVVVALVDGRGWPPLLANPAGWLLALGVSFAGHHRLSFRAHGAPVGQAFRRFLVISAGGFGVNEAAYAVLVRTTGQRYDLLLAVVLVAVAAVTYLLGRHWAFLRADRD